MTCRDAMSAYFRIANIGFKGHMTSLKQNIKITSHDGSLSSGSDNEPQKGLGKWKRSSDEGIGRLDEVIGTMQACHARSAQIQEEWLTPDRAKEACEVADHEMWKAEHKRCVAKETTQQWADAWLLYENWAESSVPLLRAKAKNLGQELAPLEGIKIEV